MRQSVSRLYLITLAALIQGCVTLAGDAHVRQVLIKSSGEAGSGIIIASNLVVTNHHVVDGASISSVKLPSGEQLRVLQVKHSPNLDMSVLITNCASQPWPALKPLSPTIGDRLALHGPQALVPRKTLISGQVNNDSIYAAHPKPLSPNSYGFGLDIRIPQGFSGGPIVDTTTGAIVGMSQGNVTLNAEAGPTGYFYSLKQVLAEVNQLVAGLSLPICRG